MNKRMLLYSAFVLSIATMTSAQNKSGGGSFPFAGVTYEGHNLPTEYPKMKRSRVIWYKLVQSDQPDQSTQPLVLAAISCADASILPADILQAGGFSQACQSSGSLLWHSPDYPDKRHPLLDGDHLIVGVVDPDNLIAHGGYEIEFVTLNVQTSGQSPLNPAPQRSPISPPGGGQAGPSHGGTGGPGTLRVSKCKMSVTGDGDRQRVPVGSGFPIHLAVTTTVDATPQVGIPVTFKVMPAAGGAGGLFQLSDEIAADTITINTDAEGTSTAPLFAAGERAGAYKVTATATCPADGKPISADFNMTNLAQIYYLAWNQQLSGDTVPTVTVTFLYETPAPQASKSGSDQSGNTADQAVLSVTDQLPQVHAMYAYNLSFGVIGSTLKETTFTRIANSPPCPSGTTPPGNKTSGTCGTFANAASTSAPVQPAIFFTTYVPQRFDAESHWSPREMIWPIAPTFGISLTQPSTDFFFGQSSEIRRGVEVVYGWHAARVSYVLGGEDPTSSASPPTGRQWKSGFSYGVTFTLNFIQSLFSGGAASK
jgi:hypothetical protein